MSLPPFMAQVRGQGTEQAGRNGDGWSDVVLIAPLLFGLSHVVVVLFPG